MGQSQIKGIILSKTPQPQRWSEFARAVKRHVIWEEVRIHHSEGVVMSMIFSACARTYNVKEEALCKRRLSPSQD